VNGLFESFVIDYGPNLAFTICCPKRSSNFHSGLTNIKLIVFFACCSREASLSLWSWVFNELSLFESIKNFQLLWCSCSIKFLEERRILHECGPIIFFLLLLLTFFNQEVFNKALVNRSAESRASKVPYASNSATSVVTMKLFVLFFWWNENKKWICFFPNWNSYAWKDRNSQIKQCKLVVNIKNGLILMKTSMFT